MPLLRKSLGFLSVLLASAAAAPPATAPGKPLPRITRADLAEGYLRVEKMLQTHPPKPDDRARIHRSMDKAAYFFFAANHSDAIREMNGICDALRGANEPDLQSFVESMRVRIAPRIAHRHRPSILNIRFARLFDLPITSPIELKLVIRTDDADGKIIFENPVQFRGDAPMPSIATKQPDAPPGRYRVELVAPGGKSFDVGRWFVIDRSLETIRAANEKRLNLVDTRDPRMFQAWVACRARNALLTDRPAEEELSQYLADPLELPRTVTAEVEALLRGEDPYAGRIGEYFRAVPAGAMYVPAWVYAPAAVKDGKPMPLVIALHGAGADERIFMEGYGAGAIKRLADKHNFIVVAPSTYWVLPNASALEGIVAAIGADYSIDRSRVFVIGHSLGGMAAAAIASRHPKDVAGAVLIAGGKLATDQQTCPVLVIAAELDPLMRPSDLQENADEARAAGLPVEFRLIDGAGHVLVCDEVLDDAIEWLLKQRPAGQP